MRVVRVKNLAKTYKVAHKAPGLWATAKHFFKREYKDVEAVAGVDFEIEPGEIVGFLGENGAGKTTTLKMLTGLIHPTAGEIEVAGHVPFERKKAFLREITLVMGGKQQLIWDLPALDSLRINAAVYEIDDAEADERIAELGEMLEVGEHLTQPVRKLSLGQRMKAELVASLLHRPSVLFLDEPTLGLDVNAQAAIRRFLKEYNAQYGATVLLTSHYMADITALAERVMLMHAGKLIYDGVLEDLLNQIAPERVVELRLSEPVDDETLAGFGDVTERDGLRVELMVPRNGLPQAVARILDALPVEDLSVHEPAVERIIGEVFKRGAA
jgi:ABC-2 type transport system ATP-binding protein